MENQPEMNEMLLVLDKHEKRFKGVKRLTADGGMETLKPNGKGDGQFMRIDRQGDFLSNLFSNFLRQLKDPTRFDFFAVPYERWRSIATELQGHLDGLGEAAQQLLSKYALNSEYQLKNNIVWKRNSQMRMRWSTALSLSR